MPNPSLPQNDSPAEQAQRKSQLAQKQAAYIYDFDTRVAPLGVAKTVPEGEGFAPILAGSVALVVLDLLGNVLAKASKIFAPETESLAAATGGGESLASAKRAFADMRSAHRQISNLVTELQIDALGGAPLLTPAGAVSFFEKVESRVEAAVEDLVTGQPLAAVLSPIERVWKIIAEVLEKIFSDAGRALLRYLDLYGPATSVLDYAEQFQTLRLWEIASNYQDDLTFAWMRLAGPNPMVVARLRAPDPRLPVTEAQYRAVMGDDTLDRAAAEGRLYLADYKVLGQVVTGTVDGLQKYLEAPLALFAVPPAGNADRSLRAVAIQLSQTPGAGSPVFTPADGVAWEIAKIHVQVADGNDHELISHLGRTHLVIEAFAMATPRQLAPEHPLYVLLRPHLQGTLAINDAAEKSLIAPGGPVDRLLSGQIASSTRLSVQSVQSFSFDAQMLPTALARRGVDDKAALPDFPYRDDALLVWDAIHGWVTGYLGIYYRSDADVLGDYELQAWLAELTSPSGGAMKDLGQDGAIRTREYLADVVTMIVFTASAQHAAVNFPQSSIMSFTPAMPLAAFAPPPSTTTGLPPDEALRHLPPLEEAALQLAVGSLLGGVYYSRLGDYDRNVPGHYFSDGRVEAPLLAFQRSLVAVEQAIGRRNLSRTPYIQLLPSSIPQSINI